ncbi:MAG TPA: O-antigen ligase family protein [Candidatus Methylomirabilis sp.]|nr:O-antigen ligase family protein [Candidatus Methylomirabilis sp.]
MPRALRLALLAVAVALPLLQAGLHPAAQPLLPAVLGILTLVALAAGVLPGDSPLFRPRWPFLLALLLLLASAWRSVYLELTLQTLLLYAAYLLAGLLAFHLYPLPPHRVALAGALVAGGLLAGAAALLAYLQAPAGSLYGSALWGTFPTSNALGGYLLLGAFCAGGLAVAARGRIERWGWGSSAVLLAAALVGTRSRGGILAAGVGLLWWGAGAARTAPGRRGRMVGVAAAAALCLAVGVALWEGPGSLARWASLPWALTGSTSEPSFRWRQLIYTWSLAIIRDHPLLGMGPGTFPLVLGQYQQVPYVTGRYAHNAWVELAAETGIPFALLLLAGFALSLRQALRALRAAGPERPLLLGITAALLASATHALLDVDWSLPAIALPVCLLLGALWAAARDGSWTVEGGPRIPARTLQGAAALVALTAFLLGATRSFAVSLQQEGRAAFAQGALGEAEGAFRAARRLNPAWYAPRYWLAEVAMRRGKAQEAVAEAAAAARLNPADGGAAFHLGRMLWAAGRLEEAEAALRRAVALDPASGLNLYGTLGDFFVATGRPGEALRWYRRATEVFLPSLVRTSEARCLAPGDRYLLGHILGRMAALLQRDGQMAEADVAAREGAALLAPATDGICSGFSAPGQGSPEATIVSYWAARAQGGTAPPRLFAGGVTDWHRPLNGPAEVRVSRILALAASETAAEVRYELEIARPGGRLVRVLAADRLVVERGAWVLSAPAPLPGG